MNRDVSQILRQGLRYRFRILKESNKWLFVILGVIFTPLFLTIHLPVSLLLIGNEMETSYAITFLAMAHILFSFVGERLSPPEKEMRWILLHSGIKALLGHFCLLHLKVNFLYWALWITPLLVLSYYDKDFSYSIYVFSFGIFTLLYMTAILVFCLLKYRSILFCSHCSRFFKAQEILHYSFLTPPISYMVFSYALLDVDGLIIIRCILCVCASSLLAHGLNSRFKREAEVIFWMHMKSCNRIYLALSNNIKNVLLSLPVAIALYIILGNRGVYYWCFFVAVASTLCLLSISKNWRGLLAPLLSAVSIGLLLT